MLVTSYNALVGPSQDYSDEAVLEKIIELRKLGNKVCLFMCRTEDQSLPQEEGCVWVSGDIAVKGIIPPHRLHIWADFSNDKPFKKFQHLFDKIVIDLSSVKSLGSRFMENSVSLLHPSPEAVFIFENSISLSDGDTDRPIVKLGGLQFPTGYFAEARKKENELKREWFKNEYPEGSLRYEEEFKICFAKIKVMAEKRMWKEAQIKQFFISHVLQSHYGEDSYLKEWNAKVVEMRTNFLKNYFESVSFCEKERYPYKTSGSECVSSYFIAKNMINKLSNDSNEKFSD